MITNESYREVGGPVAQALADIGGELMDIAFAHSAVQELLDSWPPDASLGPDSTSARALWMAAIVSYARCFRGGIRTSGTASTLISRLRGLDQSSHEYFLDLRDKHVAHSVNALEQATVFVRLGPAPDFEVGTVGPFQSMTIIPDRATAERFKRLVEGVQLLMVGRLEDTRAAVFTSVQAMSPSERGQLPALVITPADPTTDLKAPRPRLRGH
jgi:hypothetical protein